MWLFVLGIFLCGIAWSKGWTWYAWIPVVIVSFIEMSYGDHNFLVHRFGSTYTNWGFWINYGCLAIIGVAMLKFPKGEVEAYVSRVLVIIQRGIQKIDKKLPSEKQAHNKLS